MSWISCCFKLLHLLFVFSLWFTALSENLGCLKCISGMNLSHANKTLLTISFILCLQNKRRPTKVILLKFVCIPKLLSNPLASCSLRSLDFIALHSAHFNNIISFPLFVFVTLSSLLSCYTSNNTITLFINILLKVLINFASFKIIDFFLHINVLF